jgi:hypothetical protein
MFEMMTSERDKQRETFDFNSPSKLNFAFARQTFLRLPFLSVECVLSLFSRIVAMGYEYARTEIIHFFSINFSSRPSRMCMEMIEFYSADFCLAPLADESSLCWW